MISISTHPLFFLFILNAILLLLISEQCCVVVVLLLLLLLLYRWAQIAVWILAACFLLASAAGAQPVAPIVDCSSPAGQAPIQVLAISYVGGIGNNNWKVAHLDFTTGYYTTVLTVTESNSAAVTNPRALLPGIGFENLNGCAMHPSSNVMYCAATTSYTGDGVSYLVRFDATSTEILGRLRMAVYSSVFDLAGNYHYVTVYGQFLKVTDPENIAGQACVAGSCSSSTLAAAAAVLNQAGDNQETTTPGSGAVLKVQFNCCGGTSSVRNHHVTESSHFTQVLRRNFADISAFQRDLDGYGSADWLIGFNAATPYDTMVVVKVSGSNAPYAVWFRVELEGGGAPVYQIGYGAAWYYAGYPYFSSNAGNGVFQVMIDELNFINEGACGTNCQWDGTKVTIKKCWSI